MYFISYHENALGNDTSKFLWQTFAFVLESCKFVFLDKMFYRNGWLIYWALVAEYFIRASLGNNKSETTKHHACLTGITVMGLK